MGFGLSAAQNVVIPKIIFSSVTYVSVAQSSLMKGWHTFILTVLFEILIVLLALRSTFPTS